MQYNKGQPEEIVKPINLLTMDSEHRNLYILKQSINKLKKELEKAESKYYKEEAKLLKQIDSGKSFDWCWKWIFTRTNVAWKDVFISRFNKKEADRILANTKATEYPHIGISGIDPEPEQKKRIERFTLRRKMNMR